MRACRSWQLEAPKAIENTQRDPNIALMNELATIFGRLDIDTTQVPEDAGTKWNLPKVKPGLLGRHCIGVDPTTWRTSPRCWATTRTEGNVRCLFHRWRGAL